MSVLDRPDNVPVNLGYCPCEGSPHPDGDVVYLYPELPAPAGLRARSLLNQAIYERTLSQTEAEALVAEVWLSTCVAAWTFLDDDGQPIPVTSENVLRALPYGKGGREIAEKADDLYGPTVMNPLVAEVEALSKRGSNRATRRATSRRKTSTSTPRKRSSTATTATVPAPE